MVLLTGFTYSALAIIIALYIIAALPTFIVELLIFRKSTYFSEKRSRLSQQPKTKQCIFYVLLFIINLIIVGGAIYLLYLTRGKGLIEK